jgi:hypothetical protein
VSCAIPIGCRPPLCLLSVASPPQRRDLRRAAPSIVETAVHKMTRAAPHFRRSDQPRRRPGARGKRQSPFMGDQRRRRTQAASI